MAEALLNSPTGVELHGLSRGELNGKRGKCIRQIDGGRVAVEIPGVGRVAIKLGNLRAAPSNEKVLKLVTHPDRYEILGTFKGLGLGKDDFVIARNHQHVVVSGSPQSDPHSAVAGFSERVALPVDADLGSLGAEFRDGTLRITSPRAMNGEMGNMMAELEKLSPEQADEMADKAESYEVRLLFEQ
mmetsp:Transcript_6678/g.11182  ORF Transcript_6678/g.11182 Transcript_6678/m.11182 type:complete len:186 (-) Transcript_6678:608-1165(-)